MSVDLKRDSLLSKVPTTINSSIQETDEGLKFKTLDDAVRFPKMKTRKTRRLEPLKQKIHAQIYMNPFQHEKTMTKVLNE